MTTKTIKIQIHGVMASIAEPLSACMTLPAIIELYFLAFSFTHNAISDPV